MHSPTGTQADMETTAVRPVVRGLSLVGMNDPVQGKVYPLTGKVVFGRDEHCDIVVDSPLVSRRHAEIEITEQGVRVHDLNSGNGTFIAGERIQDCLLAPGDEVRFDEVRFVLRGPQEDLTVTRLRLAIDKSSPGSDTILEQPALPQNTAFPALVGGGNNTFNERYVLTGSRVQVGRAETSDLVLPHPTISTHHADLTEENGHWRLEDLDSRNGTFVNGHRITSQILANGDVVRFGQAEFLYDHPPGAQTRPPGRMSEHEDITRTSMTPIARPSRPWLWGIASFVLVALLMAIAYLLRE